LFSFSVLLSNEKYYVTERQLAVVFYIGRCKKQKGFCPLWDKSLRLRFCGATHIDTINKYPLFHAPSLSEPMHPSLITGEGCSRQVLLTTLPPLSPCPHGSIQHCTDTAIPPSAALCKQWANAYYFHSTVFTVFD